MSHHVFPMYSILIEPKWLEDMQSNIWDEKPVPSKLDIDNCPYEIGITYRGDHIRKFRKKSFRIELGTYSNYFEGREFHLNAEYRDPSLMRSKLSFDFFQTTGTFSPDCKHVFLELNGKSEGIYLQLESVDDLFLQKRQLPNGPIFYATNYHANFSLLNPKHEPKKSLLSGYRRKIGNDQDALDLEMLIYKVNTIPRSDFGGEIMKT